LLMGGPSCTRSKGTVVAVFEGTRVSHKIVKHVSAARYVRMMRASDILCILVRESVELTAMPFLF